MLEHEFKSQMLMVFSFSEVDATTSLNMEKNGYNPLPQRSVQQTGNNYLFISVTVSFLTSSFFVSSSITE